MNDQLSQEHSQDDTAGQESLSKSDADHRVIAEAADTLFLLSTQLNPFLATFVGIREAGGLVPELDETKLSDKRAELQAVLESTRAVETSKLELQDRITQSMVIAQAANSIATIDARRPEFSVSPISSMLPATALMTIIPKTPIVDKVDADAYLERCSQIAGMLDSASEWLERGVSTERTPVLRLVEGAVAQIDAYLGSDSPERELGRVTAADESYGDAAWRDQLFALVRDEIRPALGRYRAHLHSRVLPSARSDERAGLCWIPGGEQSYAAAIAEHTTTEMTAEEIHQLGLEVVEELRQEAQGLGERVFGTRDLAEIRNRLRTDRALYFSTSEEIVASATRNFELAEALLPEWIGTLPETRCEVRAQPALEAKNAPLAYYRPGDPATDQPGVFWVNTDQPETHSRFELPALCAHESVPGHHVQWSLAREAASQSRYRRYAVPTSFIEGWALYCERLGEEMGLYQGDLERLGLWSLQSWRAARLVVDTGIHAKGWSREQARNYLRDNTVTTERNIAGEVDRYIGNAGQALAYMVGGLEFAKLRSEAQRRLGSDFRVGEFHSCLLENGALPLHALHEVIQQWLVEKER